MARLRVLLSIVLVENTEAQVGGDDGIRTNREPVDSATYTFHNAGVVTNTSVAVAPCTLWHACSADGYRPDETEPARQCPGTQ